MPKKTGKIDRFIKNLPMSITKFVFKTEPGCRFSDLELAHIINCFIGTM